LEETKKRKIYYIFMLKVSVTQNNFLYKYIYLLYSFFHHPQYSQKKRRSKRKETTT
jgi:hypothetical protein